MPKYLIEMHDGRKFQVEADSQPSEADVLAKLGESAAPPSAVAAPVDRGGLAHPLTSVVAPELEAARGLLPAPVEQPIMARSRTGALYPSAIGTGAKTIAKAAGDVAIDQAEGATSPVALATAGAGKIASSLAQSPLARKAAGKLLQFIGDFDLRKPLQSTVGRAGDALVSSVEKGDVSLPGYPRTGTTPALPVAPSGPVSPHLDLTQPVQAGSLTQEQVAERIAAVQAQGGLSADARAQFEAAKAARHGPVGVTAQPPAVAMPEAVAAKPMLTAPETKEYFRLRMAGKSDAEAKTAIEAARAFQTQFGTPSPTAAETRFPKGMRGGVAK